MTHLVRAVAKRWFENSVVCRYCDVVELPLTDGIRWSYARRIVSCVSAGREATGDSSETGQYDGEHGRVCVDSGHKLQDEFLQTSRLSLLYLVSTH